MARPLLRTAAPAQRSRGGLAANRRPCSRRAMAELWKVTSFIVRAGADGPDVLLLRHLFAGVQFPAGTVEAGEAPADAALREASEETGLADFGPARAAGEMVETI